MGYKKIISLGLAAGLMAVSLHCNASNDISVTNTTGVSAIQVQQVIERAQQIDISHIAPNVKIELSIMNERLMQVGNVGGGATMKIMSQTCTIDMPVSNNFTSARLGTEVGRGYLNEVTKAADLNEEQLRTEFAIIHEAAHCNLYANPTPFIHTDKNIQDNLNKYYKFSGAKFTENGDYQSYYYILHENYADTLAAMEVIRKYGDSKEVLSMLTKITAERQEVALTSSKNGFDSHSTSFSLEEVLRPETITRIMLAPSNSDLQVIALDIANKGALKVVNTYQNVDNVVSVDSLYTGASYILNRMVYGTLEHNNTEGNVNLHMESNELFKIAQKALIQLKEKNSDFFGTSRTKEELTRWLSDNHENVYNEIVEQTNINLETSEKNGHEIVISVASGLKDDNIGVKPTLKDIKNNTMNKLAELNKNTEQKSVLANIQQIREGIDIKLSSTPTKKP